MAIKVDFKNKNYHKSGSLIFSFFSIYIWTTKMQILDSKVQTMNEGVFLLTKIVKSTQGLVAGGKMTPILLSYHWLA